jgi:hypothetical protein
MAEPVLVVDLGRYSTKAALVAGGPAMMLRDPRNGEDFPGAPAIGDQSAMAALLSYLGEATRRLAERSGTGLVERLTLTVPPATADADALIAAGERAGFGYVELVSALEAAVLDQAGRVITEKEFTGPVFTDGDLLLVFDLGETWTAGLCRPAGDAIAYHGHETAACGREIDARLLDDLRSQLGEWVEPALTAPGEPGQRAQAEALAFLRRLKHGLGEATEVSDQLAPGLPPYQLELDWLQRVAEPGLRWLAASSRTLLARATTGTGADDWGVRRGATLTDVAAVIVVGGGARIPQAELLLQATLGRPVVTAPDPEYAVLRGAARWAAGGSTRQVVAEHPRWRVEALSWPVPGGRARLENWLRPQGDTYQRGAVLARIRTVDDQVYDLTAPNDGVLLEQSVRAGEVVGPTLVLPAKRPASCLAGDPPDRLQQLSASGEWLLTPDGRYLVECSPSAQHVKLWSIPDGRLVNEFVPRMLGMDGRRGRVFVSPQGRLSLVAWDPSGTFSVWDIWAGRRLATFRDTHAPEAVLVNELQWRLTAEADDTTSAGRYRRRQATVWDLTTGTRIERVTEDLHRRLVGFHSRSAIDAFGEGATSPCGRLRAVGVHMASGGTALALCESTSDSEIFRTEYQPGSQVRMAFTPDGKFLLANCESVARSQVDVWEL